MAPDNRFVLPTSVVGPADVGRLRREMEAVNEQLRQNSLRNGETATPQLPHTSRMLVEFVSLSKLDLGQAAHREAALAFLENLHEHAPVLHISFAVDPSATFTGKIITWLRQNIHPQVLLQVGLQPSIAAGCVLRTPNHYYDFSLRRHFAANHDLLIQKLESLTSHE